MHTTDCQGPEDKNDALCEGFGTSELFARVVVSFVKCLVSLSELKVGKEQRCLALFLQLQASVFGRPKRWFRLHSM